MSDDVRLSGFLDKELDAKQLAEMKNHVERDTATKTKVDVMRGNDDLMREALDEPMQEGVPDRFIAQLIAALKAALALWLTKFLNLLLSMTISRFDGVLAEQWLRASL